MGTTSEIREFAFEQVLPPLGFTFPTRMTVLPLAAGQIALVSAIPIDSALAAELASLGEVAYLIAPNLLHHLYLGDASQRYPKAQVLAPPGLAQKRPDLRIDGTLDQPLPAPLAAAIDVARIAGAPTVDEFVFYVRASRTLVVTDLVFNITQPRGFVANLLLFCMGGHGKLAQTYTWRLLVRDRTAYARSVQALLELAFDALIVAHGEPIAHGAHAQLAKVLRAKLPTRLLSPLLG